MGMLRAQFERMGEAAGQTVAAVWAATVRADAAASGWVRPVGAGRARVAAGHQRLARHPLSVRRHPALSGTGLARLRNRDTGQVRWVAVGVTPTGQGASPDQHPTGAAR